MDVEVQRMVSEVKKNREDMLEMRRKVEGAREGEERERRRRVEAERREGGVKELQTTATTEGVEKEDFGAFVKLKKENHALRMQVTQLQQTLTGRGRSKR